MYTLTAILGRDGAWKFSCPIPHERPSRFGRDKVVCGEHYAVDLMKNHMDDRHPGTKVRFMLTSSHTTHTTYAAVNNVETGDLL